MAAIEPVTFVNGERKSHIATHDRGLAYGDGLFETMRLEQGRLPFLPLHLDRLRSGCERLQLEYPERLLRQQLDQLLGSLAVDFQRRALVKVMLTRGAGGRGYLPAEGLSPSIVLSALPFPRNPIPPAGISAFLCQYRLPDNPRLAGIKHLNRLDQVLAALEWRGTDCHEGLLFSVEGLLVEAVSRNVFLLDGGELLTPSLQMSGVAGIFRRLVLEDYAARLGLPVREATIRQEQLFRAQELILTNSVSGAWPVAELVAKDGTRFELGGQGLASRLQALFEADIQARVAR